jgi:hypothetical protein
MAERIQVELVDDIDGSPAQHTVTFALDGVTYEIDLSERHAKQLRSVFSRYIERARKAAERAPRGTRQQEREERQTRQANRQLTEQIRGAAARTREHLKAKDQPSRVEEPVEESAEETLQESVLPEPANAAQAATSEAATSEQEDSRVPAVSLPQFSSAVD